MSGLLASGGDAYALYSGNHVNAGLYWNASFVVCFITTIHVPLPPNYEEIRLVRVSVYEGGCSRRERRFRKIPHTHTHTHFDGDRSEGPGRVLYTFHRTTRSIFHRVLLWDTGSAIAAYYLVEGICYAKCGHLHVSASNHPDDCQTKKGENDSFQCVDEARMGRHHSLRLHEQTGYGRHGEGFE